MGDTDEATGNYWISLFKSSFFGGDRTAKFPGSSHQIELQKRCPLAPPLRLLVLGEGGTGKSEVVKKAAKREWEIRVRHLRAGQNRDNSEDIGEEAKRRLVDKFRSKNWALARDVIRKHECCIVRRFLPIPASNRTRTL